MKQRRQEMRDAISPQSIQHLESSVQNLHSMLTKLDKRIESEINKIDDKMWTLKEVLTSSEACMFLGISPSYLYKLTSAKLIPYYKPNGGMIFFNHAELKQWAQQNPVVARAFDKSNSNTASL